MQSDAAISARNLSKCYQIYDKPRDRLLQMFVRSRKQLYREFWALNDVSFDIRKGGAVGIIGKNGSGKSTLLQIVCGTLSPNSGTVTTSGRVAALLELGSGFNPEFTGRENVYMNATVLGLRKSEVDQRFEKIAEFADIGDFIEQPVKTYSSGMYMRLAFAVAAHVDAEILVIDEALAVGDAMFTQKCMRFLRDFKQRGTLLFVSHDAAAVIGLCDEALWLNGGQTMAFGPAKEVSEKYLAFVHEQEFAGLHRGEQRVPPSNRRDGSAAAKRVVTPPSPATMPGHQNAIEVFDFKPGVSQEFGMRGAEIQAVTLLDGRGEVMPQIFGGEDVRLRIEVGVLQEMDNPIVGFYIKDRLGQALFGDNTYLTYRMNPMSAPVGSTITAEFRFSMPILPVGDYSIAVAVASGTQDRHVQHHWIHDAVVVKSLSSSVSTGLVGIPMHGIFLEIEDNVG